MRTVMDLYPLAQRLSLPPLPDPLTRALCVDMCLFCLIHADNMQFFSSS